MFSVAVYRLDVSLEVAVVYLSSNFLAVYYEYKKSSIQQTVIIDAVFFRLSISTRKLRTSHLSHIFYYLTRKANIGDPQHCIGILMNTYIHLDICEYDDYS